ncbi:transcription factor MYB44-like protein [Tanacetum coccineum]
MGEIRIIFDDFLKDDPYSRRFNEYREEFANEIEQLANKYDLRGGKKIYALDDVWEKCEKFHDTAYPWHNEGFSQQGIRIRGLLDSLSCGPWSPEEDEMLLYLFEKHGPGNWSLIGQPAPPLSALLSSISRTIGGAQNGNLSHEVGGVRGHQAPSIGDMARDDISTQGTHIYSRDGSAPTWNALNERDSSVSFTPEEGEMFKNLFEKHGPNWSLISKSIPGKSAISCELRWLSLQRPFTPEEDEMLENLLEKYGPNWSLITKSIPGKSAMACELRWKSSSVTKKDIPDLNLSLAVGGVSGHQAPSISDMARDNMSSEGTHCFSRDRPAPSWNDLNERDSSQMITQSDNVQEFRFHEFEPMMI